MIRAKKRALTKEPEFWKVLKRTERDYIVGYKGFSPIDVGVYLAPYHPVTYINVTLTVTPRDIGVGSIG